MATATVLEGVEKLTNFMKGCGGAPREWFVGIAADAGARLAGRGQQHNPYACREDVGDEKTARAVLAYFLQTGAQLDRDGPGTDSPSPPTQLYAYRRSPRFSNFGEFLKQKAAEKDQYGRRERRSEWVSAVERLNEQIRAWLHESDPDLRFLEILPFPVERLEQGLGAYQVEGLRVSFGDETVAVTPVGRNVVGFIGPGDAGVRAEGRVDVGNGAEKYTLYRALEGGERWYVLDEEHRSRLLDRGTFEAILKDLLS